MSHLVTIRTQVRDPVAVMAACQRLKLPAPQQRTVQLFSAQATGLAVKLPEWRYPLVCHLASGTLHYDNFGGHWGDPRRLDQFLQAYAVEKCRLEARRQGHSLFEQRLADGSIRLLVQVGGGAV